MNDAEHETTSSVVPSRSGPVAHAGNDGTKGEQSDGQLQDAEHTTKTSGNGEAQISVPYQPDGIADGDSEAETLIASPEKRRDISEIAPKLQPDRNASAKDNPIKDELMINETDTRRRKRKRAEDDAQDDTLALSPSRRSSPLSSASSDGKLDTLIRHKSESPRSRRRNGVDRHPLPQPQEIHTRGTALKPHKRRPSDILPHGAEHRTKHQNHGIDSKSPLERRETRSATYPRRSSEERSISPEPISRREHRRGASTQLSSLALDRKRRSQLPHINTKRNHSVDQHSSSADESSSPPPSSRPRPHKFVPGEHDTISPAKNMGIRKVRDKNGRTFLARACNNNEIANVKARLAERPEDLNVADNAGNTPLQIAALEGYTDIVQHLLENGCEVDTTNCDKDTPLIDAVENAHVEVVKLLLDYGADPRRQNAKGEEPSELVPTENEQEYQEIRRLLSEAKQRKPKQRRHDDQIDSWNREGSSRAASAASPRDSPPALGPRSPPAVVSRRKTGRSESTPNHLLWQANTPENLIKLAEKGDVPGVVGILNVIDKAGPESLIAAAKAGHEEVLQLLLGLGDPEANPRPIESIKPGFNTPMLAAIGRGKPEIIKLLLNQNGFNPATEYKGRKYYEISEERQGHEWRSEYKMLKDAYDKYVASRPRKNVSPRKVRELDKEKSRQVRDSSSPVAVKHHPQTRSPALSHKSLSEQTSSSVREGKRQQNGSSGASEKAMGKHMRKPTTDHSTAVASDQDRSIKRTHKSRRSQSDLIPPSELKADTSRKRRRLVTGKEHRRATSSTTRNLDSDDESTLDTTVKHERTEKPVLKRSRSSLSPEQTRSETNVDPAITMSKKRRTLLESSPEEGRHVQRKITPLQSSRESTQTIEVRPILSDVDEGSNTRRRRKSSPSSAASSPDTDEVMRDVRSAENQNTAEQTQPVHDKHLPSPDDQSVPLLDGDSTAQIQIDPSNEDDAKQIAARQAQQEQEKKAAEEEAQRAAEEAAAAERKRVEEAEARRILEEAEARKRAEEEVVAKKKEEEDRQEQAKREMEERRRRQEEQKRQEFLENEKRRREALPSALCECARMLDQGDSTVRSHEWLKKFKDLYTVTTYQIDPNCAADVRDDEWIPNFQVAALLATKDLNLRQYTSLERRHVSSSERQALWRVANMDLSYAYFTNAFNTPVSVANKAYDENLRKFMAMEELFWVKVSQLERTRITSTN
jgi:ankyrin repeat protein